MSGPKASRRVTRSDAGPVTSNGSTRWPARAKARSMVPMVSGESNSASSSDSVTRRLCVRAMRIRATTSIISSGAALSLALLGVAAGGEQLELGQVVIHPQALGLEVVRRVLGGGDHDRDAADHLDAQLAKGAHLRGVV